jgi:hypothetical protein
MRDAVLKKVEYGGGYVIALPPNKVRKSWLIEVWKRRVSGTHYRTDKRIRHSEQQALETTTELAQFLNGAARSEGTKS